MSQNLNCKELFLKYFNGSPENEPELVIPYQNYDVFFDDVLFAFKGRRVRVCRKYNNVPEEFIVIFIAETIRYHWKSLGLFLQELDLQENKNFLVSGEIHNKLFKNLKHLLSNNAMATLEVHVMNLFEVIREVNKSQEEALRLFSEMVQV